MVSLLPFAIFIESSCVHYPAIFKNMVFECMFCGRKPDSSGNLTLHKFPSDEESSKKWLEQMGLPNLKINKAMRLCSQHFVASMLKRNKKYTTVKNEAVPTIFNEEYKNSCVYCKAKKGENNRLFHRFPLYNDTLTAQWLKNMDMKDFYPTSHSLLCSSHFEDSCYRPNTGRSGVKIRLKAIPTIFTKASSSSEETDDCEKRPLLDFTFVKCEVLTEDSHVASLEYPEDPITPNTVQNIVENDHAYTYSPISIRKSYDLVKKKLILTQYESKKKSQKIKRLQKKVATLQDTVQELQQRKNIPESGFASIADLEFLRKYFKQVNTEKEISLSLASS